MKYLILISALFLTSCASVENIRDSVKVALHPATETEKIAVKVDDWAAQKSAELSELFSKGFPIHRKRSSSQNPSTEWLSEGELLDLKLVSERVSPENLNIKLENYDKSMKILRETYDGISETLTVITNSKDFIDLEINRSSFSLASDLGMYTFQLLNYCKSLGIIPRDCSDDAAGQATVRQKFYSDNPSFESYYNWLGDTQDALKSAKHTVGQFGLGRESKSYLTSAKRSGCESATSFNFWGTNFALSRSTPYSGKVPSDESIYDLGGFKVLQSTRGGVLLMPNYQDSYRAQPIFIRTEKKYVDGYTFKDSEQLVCFNGRIKEYSSLLGANRKIYSFQAITDNDEYYFLPWGS